MSASTQTPCLMSSSGAATVVGSTILQSNPDNSGAATVVGSTILQPNAVGSTVRRRPLHKNVVIPSDAASSARSTDSNKSLDGSENQTHGPTPVPKSVTLVPTQAAHLTGNPETTTSAVPLRKSSLRPHRSNTERTHKSRPTSGHKLSSNRVKDKVWLLHQQRSWKARAPVQHGGGASSSSQRVQSDANPALNSARRVDVATVAPGRNNEKPPIPGPAETQSHEEPTSKETGELMTRSQRKSPDKVLHDASTRDTEPLHTVFSPEVEERSYLLEGFGVLEQSYLQPTPSSPDAVSDEAPAYLKPEYILMPRSTLARPQLHTVTQSPPPSASVVDAVYEHPNQDAERITETSQIDAQKPRAVSPLAQFRPIKDVPQKDDGTSSRDSDANTKLTLPVPTPVDVHQIESTEATDDGESVQSSSLSIVEEFSSQVEEVIASALNRALTHGTSSQVSTKSSGHIDPVFVSKQSSYSRQRMSRWRPASRSRFAFVTPFRKKQLSGSKPSVLPTPTSILSVLQKHLQKDSKPWSKSQVWDNAVSPEHHIRDREMLSDFETVGSIDSLDIERLEELEEMDKILQNSRDSQE